MFTRLVILVFFAHVIGNRTAQAQSCALHTNLLNERVAVHTLHHVDQANLVLEGVSDPRTQDDDNGHNLEATQPTAYVELRNRRSLPTPRRKSKTKVSWIQFRTLCDVPKEHPETTRGALNVTMMAWNAVRRVAAPSGIHFKLNVVGVRLGGAANSQHVVHERTLLSHTLGRENIQYVFTSALWQQPNRPSRRGSEVSEHLELILEDRYAFQRFIPLRVGMYLWYDNRSILPDPALMPIVRSGSDLKQSFKAGPVPTLFSPHFTVLGSDFLRQILPFLNVVNTRRLFQVSPNRKVVEEEEEEEEEEKVGVERENMVVASLRKFLSHAQLDGRSSIKTHEQLNKQNRCVRKVIPVSSTFQCAKTPAMICQTDDGEYLFPWLSEYYATRGLCRLFVVQPLDAKGISGVDVHHTGSAANLTESTPLIESELEHIPIKGRRKNRMRQLFAKKDVQPWNETSNQTQEPSEKDPERSHRAGTKQLVKNVHPRLQFQFGAAPIFSKYPHTGKVVLVLLTAWIYRNVPTSSNVRFVLERESSQTYPRTLQFNTRVTMNGPLGGSSSRNDEPDASVLKDLWAESLSTPPREHYTPFAQVYALNGSHAEEWADLSSHSRLSFSFTYDSTEESTLHVRDVIVALTVLHPAVWRSILTAQTPPTQLIAQTIRFHRSTWYRATQTVLAPLVDLAHTKKVHTISLWAPVLVLGIVTLVLLCCINIVVVLNVFRRRYVRYYLPEDAFFTT